MSKMFIVALDAPRKGNNLFNSQYFSYLTFLPTSRGATLCFVILTRLHNSSSPSAPNLFVQRSISVLFYGLGNICYCIKLDIDFISHCIFCMPEIFHNKDQTSELKKKQKTYLGNKLPTLCTGKQNFTLNPCFFIISPVSKYVPQLRITHVASLSHNKIPQKLNHEN